ncbi:LamG domain-containing protein [Candidatus Parabeggiatoa sp. HSG14]|uniref:LamG domain-containing protein n=1 Tax=Candidatus Parabeggiatoa sp. HSG14 TaxID=3055593 RepID=UPI0025A80DD4|nr:LamG domain-containing protein [Thiotrichales bacterium HSG14]
MLKKLLSICLLMPTLVMASGDLCDPKTSTIGDCVMEINKRIKKLEKENQAQQEEIQALKLTNGLVAYYPFNGNANDVSGNGHHGTVKGATLTKDRLGNADSAYEFDGTDDYIDMKDSPLIQSLVFGHGTVLVWFKTHATKWGDTVGYYNAGDGEDGFLLRYQHNGSIYFILGDSSGNNEAYSLAKHHLGNDKWHYVANVWDGSEMFLYVDGKLVDSKPYEVRSKYHWKPVRLTVGAYPSDTSIGTFKGQIDDIRIYNRALTDVEIKSLYKHR